jgi:amino acid transporter
METAEVTSPPDGADRELERGSIGLPSAVVQGAAFVAPTAGIVATVGFIATYAGLASPLAFTAGTIICLAIGIVVGEYARRVVTAGSFYSFLRSTFGASAGFVAGIILALSYFIVFGFQLGFFGSFIQGLGANGGLSIAWQIIAIALVTLSVVFTIRGIRPSLRFGLIALGFEIAVLMAVAIIVIAKGGASGNSLEPFNPSKSLGGQHGFWIAVVYTIFAFTGFESAATLGEEVKRPRYTIPLAVIGTVVAIGLFEIIMSYATVIGFGTSKAGVLALTKAPTPIPTIATRYAGPWLNTLVTLAIVSSFTALNLTTVSALSRMTYSMARDRLLPGWLGGLNRWHSPGRAAVVLGVASLVYVLAVGSHWGPTNLATWTSYFATLFWILAYGIVIIGIVRFIWTKFRSEWSWWRHGLIPLIAFGGVVWVARGNVTPLPPSPLDYFIWATLGITLAVMLLAYWLKRSRPEIVERAAYVFDEQEHEPGSAQQATSVAQDGQGAEPLLGPESAS